MTTTEPAFAILPLAVTVKGEVLTSNLADFCGSVSQALARINTELVTDTDFADAKEMVKTLKAAEQSIEAAKVRVLEGAGSVLAVLESLDNSRDNISRTRLTLDKKVKEQGEKRREDLISQAVARIDHPWRKERFEPNCRAVIRGKSSFENMMSDLEKLVDDINRVLADNRGRLAAFEREHPEIIFDSKSRMNMEIEEPGLLEHRLDSLVTQSRLAREKAEAERIAREAQEALAASPRAGIASMGLQADSAPLPKAPMPTATQLPLPAQNAAPANHLPLSPEKEKADFAALIVKQMGPVKEARGKLKDPGNIEKAKAMAQAFNQALGEFLKP